MAQHDYVIDNQAFPATRADINSVLQAIVSNNSGSSAPSTTFANQIWYDSSANILYIRNEDNDANIPLLQLDQSGDVAATLATIIDVLDKSGTNQAGTDLTIRAGAGTGTGAGGSIKLEVADGGSSGSSVNSHATAVTIADNGDVGIGTTSPTGVPTTTLHINGTTNAGIHITDGASGATDSDGVYISMDSPNMYIQNKENGFTVFETNATERMRITSDGTFLIGKTATDFDGGIFEAGSAGTFVSRSGSPMNVNRNDSDGKLIGFSQDGTEEGTISVSGTTVSYNGGHLSRWSQLNDGSKDTSIVKGTVMTNLDKMAVWSHDAVAATYYVDGDALPEGVSVGDEKTPAKDAYTEDNEQLNCMAVSSVEGDTNVAGVFVNWDADDDKFNDMNVAMTGDMVIRIAKGITVDRGDLLMSAGDGTAKPQDDDIVRSKTIAKVTSTNVTKTYDDGSYLVPCVLMAC